MPHLPKFVFKKHETPAIYVSGSDLNEFNYMARDLFEKICRWEELSFKDWNFGKAEQQSSTFNTGFHLAFSQVGINFSRYHNIFRKFPVLFCVWFRKVLKRLSAPSASFDQSLVIAAHFLVDDSLVNIIESDM